MRGQDDGSHARNPSARVARVHGGAALVREVMMMMVVVMMMGVMKIRTRSPSSGGEDLRMRRKRREMRVLVRMLRVRSRRLRCRRVSRPGRARDTGASGTRSGHGARRGGKRREVRKAGTERRVRRVDGDRSGVRVAVVGAGDRKRGGMVQVQEGLAGPREGDDEPRACAEGPGGCRCVLQARSACLSISVGL